MNAIRYNYSFLKSRLDPKVKIMGVVKADAYGHGAIEVSKVLIESGIDYLATATIEEAIEIRNFYKNVPILVLGFVPNHLLYEAVTNDITLTLYNTEIIPEIERISKILDKKIKVHIKIDTGMSRLGFLKEDINGILNLRNLNCLDIEGIFTHFSSADSDEEYTRRQYDEFVQICNIIEENGLKVRLRHCCNSAAIIKYPYMHMDMVRPGILVYGYSGLSDIQPELKPAMSLKSHIVSIKEVAKGTRISYGGTFVTDRKSIIGTMPVGYADGYSRRLSNNATVIIHDYEAPVIGLICMDQCVIDITDLPEVKLYDEVVLMGSLHGKSTNAEDLAKKTGSIVYEILCSIGKRVPRIYLSDCQTNL